MDVHQHLKLWSVRHANTGLTELTIYTHDPIGCSFLTWFGHDFPARQLSVRSFLIAATTRYSGFFLLSLVMRFACDTGQLAKIWIWVSSEVITICISGYMDISRPADYFITCQTVLTRPKKVETAVHGCNCWLSVWTLSCRCPIK